MIIYMSSCLLLFGYWLNLMSLTLLLTFAMSAMPFFSLVDVVSEVKRHLFCPVSTWKKDCFTCLLMYIALFMQKNKSLSVFNKLIKPFIYHHLFQKMCFSCNRFPLIPSTFFRKSFFFLFELLRVTLDQLSEQTSDKEYNILIQETILTNNTMNTCWLFLVILSFIIK